MSEAEATFERAQLVFREVLRTRDEMMIYSDLWYAAHDLVMTALKEMGKAEVAVNAERNNGFT